MIREYQFAWMTGNTWQINQTISDPIKEADKLNPEKESNFSIRSNLITNHDLVKQINILVSRYIGYNDKEKAAVDDLISALETGPSLRAVQLRPRPGDPKTFAFSSLPAFSKETLEAAMASEPLKAVTRKFMQDNTAEFGLSKKLTTKAVSSARDSNFAQILDMTYQMLSQTAAADELPSGCHLEASLLRLVSNPKQRQEAIDELYRASETAGTWALLKDGPPHPSRIWSELEHFTADDPTVTDEDKGKQLEGASILGLVNYPDGPINRSSSVYAAYYGVTDDMEERLNRGHRQGIEGLRDLNNGHYRIARFILKLQNSDWRMYKLTIIDSNSRMGHHSNFRYSAEQAIITYNDSYNQRLIEGGTRMNTDEVSEPQGITAIVVHFPVADNPMGRLLGIFEDKVAWQIEKPDLRDMLKADDGDEDQEDQEGKA
ncbi:hypothetical protein DL769_007134 [Monosporascus sp. CRB-8-3]|nr:hypothetical protein DL769_007134 [Monosporascus sp. CRB-8-3]